MKYSEGKTLSLFVDIISLNFKDSNPIVRITFDPIIYFIRRNLNKLQNLVPCPFEIFLFHKKAPFLGNLKEDQVCATSTGKCFTETFRYAVYDPNTGQNTFVTGISRGCATHKQIQGRILHTLNFL